VEDREIAGLVASGLAYGRVSTILKSAGSVLDLLGPSPSAFLETVDEKVLGKALEGFRHRFTPGREVAGYLLSVSRIQREYGLVGNCLAGLMTGSSYGEALDALVQKLTGPLGRSYLLPRPSKGSACKRLHLFMRWMVRHDEVDPGGWNMISPSELMVPVDVHMFRAGRCLGFTARSSADGRTAAEITEGFRRLEPEDPVKYDFALTRFGIQNLKDCSLFARLFS
jgi:uncharacterized protein (TIGR02757 family)